MRLIKKQEVQENVNSIDFCIAAQQNLRAANAQTIFFLARSTQVPIAAVAKAITMVHFFFIKRSYLSHDRFVVCTAALFLCGKIQNIRKKVDDYSKSLIKLLVQCERIPKVEDALLHKEVEKYSQQICITEMILIKDFNFNFQIDHSFHTILQYAADFYSKEDSDCLIKLVFSFHAELLKTEAVILYSPSSISLALLLFGAQCLSLPKLSDPEIDLSKAPNKLEQHWYKKINLDASIQEIEGTLELLDRSLQTEMGSEALNPEWEYSIKY